MPAAALDFRSAEPLYRQLARDLRARIAAGEWTVDQRLPAEADLAHDYAVGRDTARKGLYELRDEGVLYGRPGERWRVATVPQLPAARSGSGRRERIVVPRGAVWWAREATPVERAERGLPAGVWVVEVRYDGMSRVFRADEVEFQPY